MVDCTLFIYVFDIRDRWVGEIPHGNGKKCMSYFIIFARDHYNALFCKLMRPFGHPHYFTLDGTYGSLQWIELHMVLTVKAEMWVALLKVNASSAVASILSFLPSSV